MNKYKNFAPALLRLGLAMVFIWFGANQLLDQTMWVKLIPEQIVSMTGLSPEAIVIANGVFEILMAVLLSFGIWIRLVAILLSVHLLMIIGDLGLTAIGVRDVGLLLAMLSVFLYGSDDYSYDKPKETIQTNI